MKEFSQADLEQLYQMCLPETAGGPVSLTMDQLLLHPASRNRAQAACRTVIRRCARGSDLAEDVLHEATVILARRLARGRLQFTPAGPCAFGGWLWSLWFRACCDAWQRWNPRRHCSLALSDLSHFEVVPAVDEDAARRQEVEGLLEQFENPRMRAVMADLAEGLSERESARQRGFSKSTIARMRALGLQQLRGQLIDRNSTDAER